MSGRTTEAIILLKFATVTANTVWKTLLSCHVEYASRPRGFGLSISLEMTVPSRAVRGCIPEDRGYPVCLEGCERGCWGGVSEPREPQPRGGVAAAWEKANQERDWE
ncbi:MAG: hypothetical protein V1862_05635 [Methanobacteriota archaeon]